jgi:hypothetical protein
MIRLITSLIRAQRHTLICSRERLSCNGTPSYLHRGGKTSDNAKETPCSASLAAGHEAGAEDVLIKGGVAAKSGVTKAM